MSQATPDEKPTTEQKESLDDFFAKLDQQAEAPKTEVKKKEVPKKPRISISDNVCVSCEG